MATVTISCPMLSASASAQSEQPPGASALSVAASVEAMLIDDSVVAAVGLDSTKAPVRAGGVLQSIDGNAGVHIPHCALRISAQLPGERAPCMHSHRVLPCFAQAAASGGGLDEDHVEGQELPPAEVPL